MRFSRYLLFSCTLLAAAASAQPGLKLHRVVNNWPTIELYFTASCNGQEVFDIEKQQVHITDNGVLVSDFELTCANPPVPQPMSVSLVLDASGSMLGANNTGVRRAFGIFASKLDSAKDEAGVIYFSSNPWTALGMTHNTTLIRKAVEELPVTSMTVFWDSIYMGIAQADSGTSTSRAVIAVTDGGDGASMHTPQDIIAYANKVGVRIFTLGLGGVEPTNMELIAMLTGGRYYGCYDTSRLAPALDSIFSFIRDGYRDCSISYDARQLCPDIRRHTVELQLADVCGDSISAEKSYSAPSEWVVPNIPHFYFDTLMMYGSDTLAATLWVQTDIVTEIPPAAYYLSFDSSRLEYRETAFVGSIFESRLPSITVTGNRILLACDTAISVHGTKKLGVFTFIRRNTGAQPTTIDIDTISASPVCFHTSRTPGIVTFPLPSPIYIHGDTLLCRIDTILLSAPAGLHDYLWTGGVTGRYLAATEAGMYSYTARTPKGDSIYSATVTLTKTPYPDVSIINIIGDTVWVCADGSVTLEAAPGFLSYLWNGSHPNRFYAPFWSGNYSATATDSCGCISTSRAVYYYKPSSTKVRPAITRVGDTLISTDAKSYQWLFDGQPIPGATQRRLVAVQTGNYSVEIGYFDSCFAVSTTSWIVTSIGYVPVIKPQLFIYPEPSMGIVTIQLSGVFEGQAELRIMNILGETVYASVIQPNELGTGIHADLSHCPSGVYTVLLKTASGCAVKMATVLR